MLQVTGYPALQEGLEYLKTYVAAAEDRGEGVLVFCEDRLTLLAEQAICEAVGGTFLSSVTTFARFLRYDGKILSKQGSVMVIGKILTDHAAELACFSPRAGANNGAEAVYEMIAQLSASKVTPEMLEADDIEAGLLKDKLHDLALVYRLYGEFLVKNEYVDENGYLALLPEAIRSGEQTRGGNVVFLGFTSFTAQALDGVRAACECAENVLGLLPAGNAEIYSRQAATAFRKVCAEYGEVKLSQLKIPAERQSAADVLRQNLFRPEVFSPAFPAVSSDGSVKIAALSDVEEELRLVCSRIKKHVFAGGRYSDAAVFLPDVNGYSILLAKVFKEYEIPYFADSRKSLSSHPFAFFLTSVLRAVADGASPQAVEQVASSRYFGDDGEYRNYLAKFCNYRGGARREIKQGDVVKEFDRDYLVSMRERLLSGMGIFSKTMTGKKFCDGVRKLYERFNAAAVTEELMRRCEDALQQEYLSKLEKSLQGVLEESESLLGDSSLSISEFLNVLENGLQACEVSLLPLTRDEVFVGDITQSRTGANKLVFALGLTDQVPARGEDTALLSDREMQRLEGVKVKIEPSVAQVNERTRENVALNICSFT
ncbi:MAG: hypothetical protein J6Z36_01955, partial [Clostridia bacterium]|nr:hypothetical protein [Clostridia bacterium]